MSQPALYFDEDACDGVFRAAEGGAEARIVFALDVAVRGAPDLHHLEYAAASGLVLVTYNREDFARLHYDRVMSGAHHSGILLLFQQRFESKKELSLIRAFLGSESAEAMQDQLRFITQYEVDR